MRSTAWRRRRESAFSFSSSSTARRSRIKLAESEGLSVGQALNIARQIADALEVAHEKAIVHRDLKPANVKITPDGVVKVLDFGLAKAVAGDGSSPDLTLGSDATEGGTRQGQVIGTAAYMSPEQARGLPVDRRTDVWSFGCVCYEMLTGRVAFAGDTVSDSIARILEREPDWSALPAATPPSIRRLLRRALAKDRKRRLRDIGDVRIEIDEIDEVLPAATVSPLPRPRGRIERHGCRGSRWWWAHWPSPPGSHIRPERNPLANARLRAHHELGRHGRARRNLARREVRGLPRRQGRTARRVGESIGYREVRQPHPRHPPDVDSRESPAKSRVHWRRIRDLAE